MNGKLVPFAKSLAAFGTFERVRSVMEGYMAGKMLSSGKPPAARLVGALKGSQLWSVSREYVLTQIVSPGKGLLTGSVGAGVRTFSGVGEDVTIEMPSHRKNRGAMRAFLGLWHCR